MKEGLYDVLKAKFLISQNALSNWGMIVMVVFLALLMIANIHFFESKLTRINTLQNEIKELRSEFVEGRSRLMRLKMESSVAKKMEAIGVRSSSVPPVKIIVHQKESDNQ